MVSFEIDEGKTNQDVISNSISTSPGDSLSSSTELIIPDPLSSCVPSDPVEKDFVKITENNEVYKFTKEPIPEGVFQFGQNETPKVPDSILENINTDIYPDVNTDIYLEVNTDIYSDVNTDICLDVSTDICPDVNTDICLDVSADICPGVNPDICPDVSTDICLGVNADMCPGVSPDICLDVNTDQCPGVNTDICLDVNTDMCPDVNTDICPDVNTNMSPDVNTDIPTYVNTNINTDINTDTYTSFCGQSPIGDNKITQLTESYPNQPTAKRKCHFDDIKELKIPKIDERNDMDNDEFNDFIAWKEYKTAGTLEEQFHIIRKQWGTQVPNPQVDLTRRYNKTMVDLSKIKVRKLGEDLHKDIPASEYYYDKIARLYIQKRKLQTEIDKMYLKKKIHRDYGNWRLQQLFNSRDAVINKISNLEKARYETSKIYGLYENLKISAYQKSDLENTDYLLKQMEEFYDGY